MKVGFIGLGKLGLPCAEVIATKHNVTGFDILDVDTRSFPVVQNIKEAVVDKEIVFVAVQTPHHPAYDGSNPTSTYQPRDFNYTQVKQVLKEVNEYATKEQLIVLISTVLPGTTRKELAPLVTNATLIYNPYLIAMGSVKWDMVNPEMIIIGKEHVDTDVGKLIVLYKLLMANDLTRYEIGTWEEAESIKIFYNTFISAKLSLVNMIQDVAMKLGNTNVDVITEALANSTKRITGPQYMTAGMGDGGPCHPRDNIALRYMAQELNLGYDLFNSIMQSREVQAENLAKFLNNLAKEHNMEICIFGKSYKPGVPYTDGSYSLLVGHYCDQVKYIEDGDITKPHIILLAHSPSHTYKYTGRPVDTNMQNIPAGSVVVDPWRSFAKTDKYKVVHYGNSRVE
jgi:UDPglucose 6-dehydrogenase|tara:strand:+ start:1528 stop:2718 length:1191 start_codon:yes stop_codon:yes gene_type:complete